jgi:hypothetical protein
LFAFISKAVLLCSTTKNRHFIYDLSMLFLSLGYFKTEVDGSQKASGATGFIKATETLRKKLKNHFKKASIQLKMYLKSLAIVKKSLFLLCSLQKYLKSL